MASKKVLEGPEKGLIHVRLTMIEPTLGSAPSDPEVYTTYIKSKKPVDLPAATEDEGEVDSLKVNEENKEDEGKFTIFHKLDDGTPFVYDYVIKGFFKNACKSLRKAPGTYSEKLTAYKGLIDGNIFIKQRRLPFKNASKITIFERPLRAETAQGPRVALSASERIEAGAVLEFDIKLLTPALYGAVIEWLDYGQYNGLCQWHNGGYGRFLYEEIDEEGNIVSGNISQLEDYDNIM